MKKISAASAGFPCTPFLSGAPALVLTPAERAIADLLLQGWTNKEIARQLGKSVETVKSQLKVLMRRSRARNRTELAHLVSSMFPPRALELSPEAAGVECQTHGTAPVHREF